MYKLEQKLKENSDKNFKEFSGFLQKKRIRIIAKRNEDELHIINNLEELKY